MKERKKDRKKERKKESIEQGRKKEIGTKTVKRYKVRIKKKKKKQKTGK